MDNDKRKILVPVLAAMVGGVFGVIVTLHFQAISRSADQADSEVCSIKWKQSHFRLSEANLVDELVAQGCHDVETAHSIAMETSDSLRSASCTRMNNVFGLCDEHGRYVKYQHWTESVSDYLKMSKN